MECSNKVCLDDETKSVTNQITAKNNIKVHLDSSIDNFLTTDDWVDYLDENLSSETEDDPQITVDKNHSLDVEMPLVSKDSNKDREDTDLHTQSFDELVENLSYNILHVNFTKLLNFLESNSRELCFPFISKCYEEVFKRIVQDVTVLKSNNLDANYKDVCNSIINTVIQNKSVYLFTCVYGDREKYKHSLLIKKVYLKEECEATPVPISSSTQESLLPLSQSSSIADPDEILEGSYVPGLVDNGFKLQCLRTTLAFVKNDNTNSMQYPDLNLEQAKFMRTLLSSVIAYANFDSDVAIKGLYRALWEAVKIFSLKYDFEVKSLESRNEKKNLVFEKTPKLKPAFSSNQMAYQKSQDITVVPKQMPKKQKKKTQKKVARIELFVEGLPPAFVLDTLNIVIDFLTDKQQGSVIFLPTNENEFRFYMKSLEWSRFCVSRSMFDGEYKPLFTRIAELLARVGCKIQANKSSNKRREVKYIKRPARSRTLDKMDTALSNESGNFFKAASNNKLNDGFSKNELTSADLRSQKDEQHEQTKFKIPKLSENARQHKNVTPDRIRDRSTSRGRRLSENARQLKNLTPDRIRDRSTSRGRSNKRGILFKPASKEKFNDDYSKNELHSADLDSQQEEQHEQTKFKIPTKTRKLAALEIRESERQKAMGWAMERIHPRNALQRRNQLVEALSVPVHSDKAMRIMEGMGWRGGALGARGNGITEPIMPVLGRMMGAGLGHVDRKCNAMQIGIQIGSNRTSDSKTKIRSDRTPESSTKIRNNWTSGNSTKIGSYWTSESNSTESQTQHPENDIIVEKTRQLLLAGCSFDSVTKIAMDNPQFLLLKTNNFQEDLLLALLELLSTDATSKCLKYGIALHRKLRAFLNKVIKMLANRGALSLSAKEQELGNKLLEKLKEFPDVIITAHVSENAKVVVLTKLKTYDNNIKQLKNKEGNETSTCQNDAVKDNMLAFINALAYIPSSGKSNDDLKFRVFILLKILFFVKSDDEELEVDCNRVLPQKEKMYIESTIESVNKRSGAGSTLAECTLLITIKKMTEDSSLGIMFNHQHTSFTLIKYSHTCTIDTGKPKRRRLSTTVNLDSFTDNADKENNEATENINHKAVDINKCEVTYKKYNADADNKIKEITCQENITATANTNSETTGTKHSKSINKKSAVAANVINKNATDIINNEGTYNNKNKATSIGVSKVIGKERVDSSENDIYNKEFTVNKVECINKHEMLIDKTELTNDYMQMDIDHSDIVNYNKDENSDSKENRTYIKVKAIENTDMFKHISENASHNTETIAANKVIETVKISLLNISLNKIIDMIEDTTGIQDKIIKKSDTCVSNSNNDVQKILQYRSMKDNDFLSRMECVVDQDLNVTNNNAQNVVQCSDFNSFGDEPIKENVNEIYNSNNSLKEIKPKDVPFIVNEEVIVIDDDEYMGAVEANVKITTGCNTVATINIDTSDESCDDNPLEVNNLKTVLNVDAEKYIVNENRVESRNTDQLLCANNNLHKKNEMYTKHVYLVPFSYPKKKMSKHKAKRIQKLMSTNIQNTKELPLLKCHGLQKGALIYTCHNKKTYEWLQNSSSVTSEFKVLEIKDVRKMALKIHCLCNHYDIIYLFDMIELYNKELSTKDWLLEKTKVYDDYVIYVVSMDPYSVNYIHASDLALYAGIDKIEFSLIWD